MKKIYTCPMHPEIQQDKPGTCPKCGGMKLVLQEEMGSHISHHVEKVTWKSYLPLIVIIGLILLVALTISVKDIMTNSFSLTQSISYFMSGFFLVFAGFKLMDLKGFADGYATYDILAKRFYPYGYVYPFIELFFGLSMIVLPHATWLLVFEFALMTFSGIGVAQKLLKKEKFQCACLGTFLKVPLTKVTIIEDFGMAMLAGILLLINLL